MKDETQMNKETIAIYQLHLINLESEYLNNYIKCHIQFYYESIKEINKNRDPTGNARTSNSTN